MTVKDSDFTPEFKAFARQSDMGIAKLKKLWTGKKLYISDPLITDYETKSIGYINVREYHFCQAFLAHQDGID